MVSIALLLLAAGQTMRAPSATPRFAEISRQANEAREQERIEDAVRLYREGVRLRPAWAEGWWYLGTLLYDQNQYNEGITALRRHTALDARSAPGWALLGLCEFETKAYGDALTHLERARKIGLRGDTQLNAVAAYHDAMLLTHFGQFEAAVDILQGFARRDVEKPPMVEAAGIAALRKPLFPAELPPEDREMVLQVGRAVMDRAARRSAEVQKEFESLVAAYAEVPNIHYLFGSFLLASDPDAGVRELKRELEISPRHLPALVEIAFEYLKRGDGPAALPYARRAAEVDGQSFVAHIVLGRALVESGSLQQGLQELELSKQQAPDSPQVRIALASAYAKAGRSADAARERAEFLRLKRLNEGTEKQ